MPDVLHLIHIQAPIERVYEALTTSDGIHGWWTADGDLNARIGAISELYFDGRVTRIRVDALEPRRVVWSTLTSFRPQMEGTTIEFVLRPEDGATELAFAQRGFAEADDGFALINTGWAVYLLSLRQYLETGAGTPRVGSAGPRA